MHAEVQPAPGLPQMLSHSQSTKPQAFRFYSETLGRIHMLSADMKRPFFFSVTTFGPSTTLSNFRFGSVMQPNSFLKVAKL